MDQRPRILFVDDEPDILTAMQRLFRRDRPMWDMVFASSGAAAMEALRGAAFAVIVSDLRMPGMDGAELLGAVRSLFPETLRIVLSGYADSELFARAWPLSHLMLSKPCEHHKLRDAIAQMVTEDKDKARPGRAVA